MISPLPHSDLAAPRLDAGALLDWYDANARALPWRVPPAARRAGALPDPYRVWLSEVMLQQTTVPAVRGYYARFLELWPGVADLAAAPLERVLAEWAGLGYYARARNLHACAVAVAKEHGGRFPQTAAGLAALPGIGPYTAAAIAAICFDEPVPVVDGNVERVMARLLALEIPVREAKDTIREAVAQVVPPRAGDFAQAMMDLGATLCAPRRAQCLICPVAPGCAARRLGDPLRFPLRAEKPQRPVRHGHAFVLTRPDGAIWLERRPAKGLLGGMAGVPGSAWTPSPEPAAPPPGADWLRAGTASHVFTHFRLEATVWHGEGGTGFGEGFWVPRKDLRAAGLPSVFKKILAAAGIEQHPAREP